MGPALSCTPSDFGAGGAMKTIRPIGKVLRDCRGGTAIEYGLILAVVVLAMMAAFLAFAGASHDIWGNVSTKVTRAGT